MKSPLRLLFTLPLIFAANMVVADQSSTTAAPVTVFVAKKIITMDPGWPEATAVAVQDGKILSVGRDLKELQPWLKGRDYKLDDTFKDKILTPGLIESHGHPSLGGIEYNLPLVSHLPMAQPGGKIFPGVKNAEQGIALIKKYLSEAKDPSKPLLVFGWDIIAMGMELDKTILDKIAPNQPLAVWDASAHQTFVNTAFIKSQKLGDDLIKKIPGVRAGADGHLNGKFQSVTASAHVLLPIIAETLKSENLIPRLRTMLDMSLQGGITTQSELTLGTMNIDRELETMNKVYNQPGAKTRLVAVTDAEVLLAHTKDVKKAVAFVKNLEKKSNDMLGYRGVKFYADDAFISQNMSMDNPGYIDGHKGVFNTGPDVLTKTLWPWWNAGFNIYVHSNGTGGNDATMNSLAELQDRKFRLDHRFAMQHFGIIRVEMARRLKMLGGMASMNPYYVYYRSEFNEANMGVDRAHTAIRLKTLIDAGVPVALHSDSPMGPPSPLEWVWIAVNRPSIESNKIMAPAERVSVHEGMRMITVDAAYHLGMENKIGSIEAGKFADFTVLEQDPYTVDPMKIKDIPIWGTVLAGQKQAVADIVPQKGLHFPDYNKLMAELSVTPEEKIALQSMTKVAPEDLPGYYDEAYSACAILDVLRTQHLKVAIARESNASHKH
jgi:predicted amidohydrolase YtcJ